MDNGIQNIKIEIATVQEYFDDIVDADQNGFLSEGDSVGVNFVGSEGVTLPMAPILAGDMQSLEALAERLSVVSSLASPWSSPDEVGGISSFQSRDRDFKILYASERGVENVYLAVAAPGYWTGRIFGQKPKLDRLVKIGQVERDSEPALQASDAPDEDIAVKRKWERQWLRQVARDI